MRRVPRRGCRLFLALSLLPIMLSPGGCEPPPPPPDPPPAEYRAEIETWRARREAQLREPDSWLALRGLYWVSSGETTIGSDPRMDMVLPDGDAPGWVGTLTLRGQGSFDWEYAPEVAAEMPPENAAPRRFRVDTDEGSPVMGWGSLSWHVIERYGDYAIRLRDASAPALERFTGLESFDVDPAWRIPARFDPYDPPRDIPMPNVLDVPATSRSPGAAVFEVDGRELRLDLTGEPDSDHLFLVFGDETNGGETYPGGRFLSVDAPNPEGWVILDFNRAYNPPCVFSPYATCPVPPPQNELPVRVEAGEKIYYGAGHEEGMH
ncbi:MAG: DUF1684 domain-containing protein [Longimicrobiales bacterium]